MQALLISLAYRSVGVFRLHRAVISPLESEGLQNAVIAQRRNKNGFPLVAW